MGDLRAGVARLAIESGAPIVPVTIGGAMRAWPKWKLLPRPAKIVVRYHDPIRLSEEERAANRDNREFQRQVTERVATSVNRSLLPSIHGAESLEHWYRQPPSHVRSYEWAPAIVTMIATVVAGRRGTLAAHWLNVILPPAIYYAYLAADLALIKPGRLAKWLRNSMPIWLILAWHYPLTSADLARGRQERAAGRGHARRFLSILLRGLLPVQKFVRGVVVSYYFSLAISLALPHGLGNAGGRLGIHSDLRPV